VTFHVGSLVVSITGGLIVVPIHEGIHRRLHLRRIHRHLLSRRIPHLHSRRIRRRLHSRRIPHRLHSRRIHRHRHLHSRRIHRRCLHSHFASSSSSFLFPISHLSTRKESEQAPPSSELLALIEDGKSRIRG